MDSILRRRGWEQALQAQAIRVAVWGEQDDFRSFADHLAGAGKTMRRKAERGLEADTDWEALRADLAAFGLRLEQ